MEIPVRPILLLADSQLLFWHGGEGDLFLRRVRGWIDAERPLAAYLGASNGDRPEFFELFRAAMEGIGITDCRHIPAEPSPADLDFLAEAHLVLLAGGDVERGWRALKTQGLESLLIQRYYAGAVLIGLSAGAVQLGHYGWVDGDKDDPDNGNGPSNGNGAITDPQGKPPHLFETLKLVPMLVDVHDEPDWSGLRHRLPHADEPVHGLGIPSGAGAILHPDLTLEAVRHPLVEWRREGDGLRQALLLPPAP